jgi:hypothetical protein
MKLKLKVEVEDEVERQRLQAGRRHMLHTYFILDYDHVPFST